MNLFKISSISFLVFLSLILYTPVFAVETPTLEQKGDVIARVNITNPQFISQKENTFKISFNITNGEGVQSGLKYSAFLVKETSKGLITVDEYVYSEILNLGVNTSIEKNIEYTAPANLSGDYTLMVAIKNYSGIALGFGSIGKIELVATVDTIEILPETCSLSVVEDKTNTKYSLTQGISISSTENIRLTCTILNSSKNDVSVSPLYETYFRTLYGDIVEQKGGDVAPILFKTGEKKVVSIVLPKAVAPQIYVVKTYFKSGNLFSNSVTARYILRGISATIQNFSLDKSSYKNEEIAKLALFWTFISDNKESPPSITLVAEINDGKKQCVSPINQVLTKSGFVEISVPVISNCNDPQAVIILKDSNGNILDQKNLSFEPEKEMFKLNTLFNKKNIAFTILGILVVAGIIIYFISLKKKENETNNQ